LALVARSIMDREGHLDHLGGGATTARQDRAEQGNRGRSFSYITLSG